MPSIKVFYVYLNVNEMGFFSFKKESIIKSKNYNFQVMIPNQSYINEVSLYSRVEYFNYYSKK